MCRLQSTQREEIFVRELGQLKVPDCLRKLEKVSSVEEDGDSTVRCSRGCKFQGSRFCVAIKKNTQI